MFILMVSEDGTVSGAIPEFLPGLSLGLGLCVGRDATGSTGCCLHFLNRIY